MADLPNDTLVAAFQEQNDYLIAQQQGWYRARVNYKQTPIILKNGTIKYISFYFKKIFKDFKYSIRHYAPVTDIQIVSRLDLLPSQPHHPRAKDKYYKISFGQLNELPQPIISHRGRALLFIVTNLQKLRSADEVNDIFNDSPLEERLWLELKKHKPTAERQFLLHTNEKNWICDFAFFCKKGVIDVECDGDTYHMQPQQVFYDKTRNNEIAAVADWDVLRFTTEHITKDLPHTMRTIMRKIDKLGGLQVVREEEITYRYVSKSDGQLNLFD